MALSGKAKAEAQKRRRERLRAERAAEARKRGVSEAPAGASGGVTSEAPKEAPAEAPEGEESQKLPETSGEERLTPRELKLATLYAEGTRSLAACCREVGLNPESHTIRDRVRKGDIGQVIAHRMRALGLTLDAPLLKIREMYDAKKEVPNPQAGNRNAVLAAIVQGTTVPDVMALRDNESQRWAAEQTLKLHNAYPKPGEDDPAGSQGRQVVQINLHVQQSQHASAAAVAQGATAGLTLTVAKPGNGNGHGHHG